MAYDDVDQTPARIEDDIRRAQQRMERLPLLQEAAASVFGSAVAPQGDIAVTVDNTGEVVSLRIEDRALTRGAAEISADLIRLLRQARQDIHIQMVAAAVGILGDNDPIVDSYRHMVDAGAESNEADEPPLRSAANRPDVP
jgi:hypothetical protein